MKIVLQRMKDHGFFLELAKCEFFKDAIPYMGHIISADGIKPNPRKLSCIKDWPPPKSVLYIRSFLGLANYFRRYIHDFTKHAVPLINLTMGNNSRSQGALADAKTLKIRDFNVPLKLSPMHQTLHWVLF